MGRIFGILLLVVGIWLGLQLTTGELGSRFGGPGDAAESATAARRAGAAGDRAHAEAEARREALLGESER